MDFKQLKTFLAVVDSMSFSKAAENLHISQPTASAHISSLEEELGTSLIRRSTKKLEVTTHGLELYDCARQMSDMMEHLQMRWSKEYDRVIQLGASSIPSAYVLPEVLPDFHRTYPDAIFSVQQGDSQEILQGVLGGRFDLGLVGMVPSDASLCATAFHRDHMVLITPNSPDYQIYVQKLSQDMDCKAVAQEILMDSPNILREFGSGSLQSASRIIEQLGLSTKDLQIAAHVNDTEAIKNLVMSGFGVSLVSERAVQSENKGGHLLVFPLPDHIASRDLYYVYRKDRVLSVYTEYFLQHLMKWA